MRYQINSFEELDTQTLYELLSVRFEVFVLEQRCIYHDFDPFDKTALHMTAWDDAGNLVGYVRLLNFYDHSAQRRAAFGESLCPAPGSRRRTGAPGLRLAHYPWKLPCCTDLRHGLSGEIIY